LKITVAAAALTLAFTSHAAAQTSSVAVGLNLGTPGVGAQVQLRATDSVVLRADADWLNLSHDKSYSGVDYDGKAKATTGGVFADWHPAKVRSWCLPAPTTASASCACAPSRRRT
jgi:hypothetical protein